jgi:hypothetical protein
MATPTLSTDVTAMRMNLLLNRNDRLDFSYFCQEHTPIATNAAFLILRGVAQA